MWIQTDRDINKNLIDAKNLVTSNGYILKYTLQMFVSLWTDMCAFLDWYRYDALYTVTDNDILSFYRCLLSFLGIYRNGKKPFGMDQPSFKQNERLATAYFRLIEPLYWNSFVAWGDRKRKKGTDIYIYISFYSYSLYIFLNLFFFSIRHHLVSYHLLFIFYSHSFFFLLLLSLFFKLSFQWSFWPVTKVMGTVSSPKRHTSLHRRCLKTLALHPPPTDQRRYQKRVWRQQWPSR